MLDSLYPPDYGVPSMPAFDGSRPHVGEQEEHCGQDELSILCAPEAVQKERSSLAELAHTPGR